MWSEDNVYNSPVLLEINLQEYKIFEMQQSTNLISWNNFYKIHEFGAI